MPKETDALCKVREMAQQADRLYPELKGMALERTVRWE